MGKAKRVELYDEDGNHVCGAFCFTLDDALRAIGKYLEPKPGLWAEQDRWLKQRESKEDSYLGKPVSTISQTDDGVFHWMSSYKERGGWGEADSLHGALHDIENNHPVEVTDQAKAEHIIDIVKKSEHRGYLSDGDWTELKKAINS